MSLYSINNENTKHSKKSAPKAEESKYEATPTVLPNELRNIKERALVSGIGGITVSSISSFDKVEIMNKLASRRAHDQSTLMIDFTFTGLSPSDLRKKMIERIINFELHKLSINSTVFMRYERVDENKFFWRCLPESLAKATCEISEATDTGPLPVVLCVLGAIFNALRGRCVVDVERDWKEPLVACLAIAEESGNRRSTCISMLRKPFEDYLDEKIDEFYTNNGGHKNQKNIKFDFCEKLKKKIVKSALKETDTERFLKDEDYQNEILNKLNDKSLAIDSLVSDKLVMPRLFADCGNFIKIASGMAEQGECLGFMEAEGGVLSRELPKAGKDCTLFLKANKMEEYSYQSTQLGVVHLRNPAMPMLFFIQEKILDSIYSNENLKNIGATSRILPYYCNLLNSKGPLGKNGDVLICSSYTDRMQSIVRNNFTQDKHRSISKLYITTEAHGIIKKFEEEMKVVADCCADDSFSAFVRKLHGTAVRFAGAIRIWTSRDCFDKDIDKYDMNAGVCLARIIFIHAFYAYLCGDLEVISNANKVLTWISRFIHRIKRNHFTAREVQQGVRGLNAATTEMSLNYLVESNILVRHINYLNNVEFVLCDSVLSDGPD